MNHELIKIFNGRIITPYRIIPQGYVLLLGEKIAEIGAGDIETPEGTRHIDAKDMYISPGFIDIHVHGGGGYDFMDGNELAFLKIAETHAQYGTTAMMPTTLSSSAAELIDTLNAYASADEKNTRGSGFLGMHLEGPYFAMNQRGAQHPKYIRDPDPTEYEHIISAYPCIRRWSAAPELKGAMAFARFARARGILTALAHTDAVYEEVLEGFENGYTLATHLYSGMSGVTRRNAYRFAGAIESAFIIEEMDVEIIADGVHLPAPFLKMIYAIKKASRIALVTDAMRGAGMPEGESIIGNVRDGLKVIIEGGVAKLPDRSSFAGSVATADRLIRTMLHDADVPMTDAIKMMTSTPARIIGVNDKKGSLAAGKDADVILFDDNINIQMTIVKGNIIYTKPARTQ